MGHHIHYDSHSTRFPFENSKTQKRISVVEMDRLLALRRQGFPDFQSSLPPRFMDRILDRMKNSSNRRGISRRRLERCSSSFAEDLPAPTSFFATRSLQLPDLTVPGIISGPEDLVEISLDAWEASKTRSSSSGVIINRFQPQADVSSEVSSSGVDSLDRDTTAICSENERGEKNLNPSYHGDDMEDLYEKRLNPTSPGASNKMVEMREKVEEVETPFQPKLSEHGITGSDPILLVYCGDNQVSEEMYFISYIFSELCLRGFAPLRYDMKMSTVTENQKMIHISRVGVIIFSMNFARSRECLDGFVAIMEHLKANDLVLIPVFFKVSVSDVRGQSGSFGKAFKRLGSSVQASQVLKWRAAMIELTSISGYAYKKG